MRIGKLTPVFPLASVAETVTDSAAGSLAMIVKAPAERIFTLSPKIPSPLLSNWTLPVLAIVTAVELSPATGWFKTSWAATATVKPRPVLCDAGALTT